MRLSIAFAAACLGTLALATAPASANDASGAKSSPPTALLSVSSETGFVTTQGRGRGFRGAGRGPVVVTRRRNNTGRNIAIGVGAAVLGAAILSQSARARGGNSCGRLDWRCSRGERWACREFYRYC